MYSWFLENVVVPTALMPTHSQFWSKYQKMKKLRAKPIGELNELQWQRLQQVLQHASKTIPFYQERFSSTGIQVQDIDCFEAFSRIPLTTKTDFQRNFPDRVTDQATDSKDWRYVSTGGTANRLIAIHDFTKRDISRAASMRALFESGRFHLGNRMVEIPPDACNHYCGLEGQYNDGVMRNVWRMVRNGKLLDRNSIRDLRGQVEDHWFYRKTLFEALAPTGSTVSNEVLDDYIHKIRQQKPYLLKSLPTYLYLISQRVIETGVEKLPVAVVKPMGASVSPFVRECIEKAFNGEYREDYGSAELGSMACDCPEKNGLHIFTDLFLIEIVKNGVRQDDGKVGKVIVTDLFNRAMPFIRYEIGDIGYIESAPCQCGQATPRLFLQGRVQDCVVTSKGKVVTNDDFTDLYLPNPSVKMFQLLETHPGIFDLLIVLEEGHEFRPRVLINKTQELLEEKADINCFTVDSIKPETGGKYRNVKSASFSRLD